MSNRTLKRRHAGLTVAVCFAFLAVPVANSAAAPVDLLTAQDYVVLGGSTVTNTGTSVLGGDLGVWSGTALPGFESATVNGATHAGDADAQQAQSDLTSAYNVAAGQTPVAQDLTGVDLGGLVLTPGVYTFDSSAQLTGTLTLNTEGDPDAQFVFRIVSSLTTAPNSEVVGTASPCNIYWQVGSSATIGTGTDFRGNILADQSISLQSGASVIGRALARIGQVSLDDNVVDASACGAGTSTTTPGGDGAGTGGTPGTTPTTPAAGTPGTTPTTPAGTPGTTPTTPGAGTPSIPEGTPAQRRNGRARITRAPRSSCTDGFRAQVRGKKIERVVFRLDGKRIANRVASPFGVYVKAAPGEHRVTARVTFTDATRAKTMTMRYRACEAAVLQPRRGPSRFTG